MKRSTLVMVLCLVLAVAMGVGGTLAYLQDTDEDVNVMTLGNVYIEQIELERKDGIDHTGTLKDGDLVEFTQGKPLYPAVDTTENKTGYTAEPTELLYWGPYVTAEGAGNGLWTDDLHNVQDKFVFVKNTGTSNAYYRTVFAFESPEGVEFSENSDKELMMNVNGGTQFFDWQEIGYATIDGVRYLLQVATYQKELLPGEISRPSLLQVVLTHNATNEDVELLGETYDILVVSQAVQTQGFADAKTALDTAFGPITADNNPWKKNGEDLEGTPVFPDLNAPVIPETNWLDDGKADTTWYDAAATEYELSNAAELAGFAKLVNEGTSFNGKTVKLAADIDLKDNCWTPIGQTGTSYGAVGYFAGNFDGQGHTIKNLFIQETNDGEHYAVGLFGFLDAAAKGKTIGNFTIDGANIKGHHWVGAAVGYLTGTLENVTVKNAVISSTHANNDACGDKTGAVVGYINGTEGKMINCSAIDSTVTSGRDAGQVVGSAKASQVVDCTATNVTVTATGDCTGANVRNEVIGRLN